jgi:hypothetical protein
MKTFKKPVLFLCFLMVVFFYFGSQADATPDLQGTQNLHSHEVSSQDDENCHSHAVIDETKEHDHHHHEHAKHHHGHTHSHKKSGHCPVCGGHHDESEHDKELEWVRYETLDGKTEVLNKRAVTMFVIAIIFGGVSLVKGKKKQEHKHGEDS